MHLRPDSDTIARLAFLPSSVCILGSGIVAIEFAKIFSTLGCNVTMLVRGTVAASLARIGIDQGATNKHERGTTLRPHVPMSPRHHDPCPSLPLSPSPLRSPDIAKRLITALTDSGTVTIMETTSVKAGGYARAAAGTHEREREKEGPPLSLTLSDDSTLVCDVFMAAAGRTPHP